MPAHNQSVAFIIHLAKVQSILSQRFDKGLGGLGFSEFLVLYHLAQAEGQQMRRVDLADKVGLTASGVTRLLLPMEKVGYIKSGPAESDARVRLVVLASGGKQRLHEARERMDVLLQEIIPNRKTKELESLSVLLLDIGGKALMV